MDFAIISKDENQKDLVALVRVKVGVVVTFRTLVVVKCLPNAPPERYFEY